MKELPLYLKRIFKRIYKDGFIKLFGVKPRLYLYMSPINMSMMRKKKEREIKSVKPG